MTQPLIGIGSDMAQSCCAGRVRGEESHWNLWGFSSKLVAMKRMLMAMAGWVVLAGCSHASSAPRPPTPVFTCEGPEPLQPTPRYRADVPMGRMEVERLSPVSPPPERSPEEEQPFSLDRARLPVVRLRMVAEAVPLGTFVAAVSREIGVGFVVAPSLVDARISLSLPDTTAQELFLLLSQLYGVAYNATENPKVIVLEEHEDVRRRRFEPQDILAAVIPLKKLPPEQAALFFCKHVASWRGSAMVLGDRLVVWDERDQLDKLRQLLRVLEEGIEPEKPSREASSTPAAPIFSRLTPR